MARNTYTTVVLQGNRENNCDEGFAAGTVPAGSLVEMDTSGTYVVHPTASGPWTGAVAEEDDFQGKLTSDSYAALDPIKIYRCQENDILALWLATSQTISINDKLVSNGNGEVKEGDGTDEHILFVALEAVTTTGTRKQIRARYVGAYYLKA